MSSTWWGKKGTDVNAAAEDGNTAVMLASHRGHREVVQYLKSRGTFLPGA